MKKSDKLEMLRTNLIEMSDNIQLKFISAVNVGGGSAGAIVALRLSENYNLSILLIEAGIDTPGFLNIPILGPLKQTSNLDWQYKTVPQKHSCFGLNNNSSLWPSGKVLGGSTHMNYMIYLKGNENDFLTWKNPNTEDWSINDINNYFNKAAEHFSSINGCKKFICNKKGSLLVREALFTTDFSDAILRAVSEIGYNVTDLNCGSGTGFMRPQLNLNKNGRRWTSDQKLKEVLKSRKNLKVLNQAVVEKVLLKDSFEAYGVKYRKNGKIKTVFATEEIILSAGTIGSAKILMLSGIGPKDMLFNANVVPKIDLPVGQNLQDHITTGLDLVLLNKSIFSLNDLTNLKSAYDYFLYGKGPFTSGMVEAVGVVHTNLVNSTKDSPDLLFMVMMAGISSDKGLFSRYSLGISNKLWNEYFGLLINETAASILPVLLHPKSVGEVKLNPQNPKGPPEINPKYLSNESDIETLIEGIRIIQKIINSDEMKKYGARFNSLKLPGCKTYSFDSVEYWKCYIQHITFTSYHPIGTCKMSTLSSSRDSVVNHRLEVRKTNKLRVVDASIMPTLPSANTNAAVVMIAEKGADLLKEDYYVRRSISSSMEALLRSRKCELPLYY